MKEFNGCPKCCLTTLCHNPYSVSLQLITAFKAANKGASF
jgi:hypothetical protein